MSFLNGVVMNTAKTCGRKKGEDYLLILLRDNCLY